MAEIALINVPFNKKDCKEPEEDRFIKAYELSTIAGFTEQVRKQYREWQEMLQRLYESDAIPVYDIPETPQWATRLSSVLKKKGIQHSLIDLNVNPTSTI